MASKQIKLEKGSLLFVQGEEKLAFFLVNTGKFEILKADKSFEGLDQSLILENSTRLTLVSPKEMLVNFSRSLRGPGIISARAIEDSVVTMYQLPKSGFSTVCKSSPVMAATILLYAYKSFDLIFAEISKEKKFYQNIKRVYDNFIVYHKKFSVRPSFDSLEEAATELYDKYENSGKEFPSKLFVRDLLNDNSQIFPNKNIVVNRDINNIFDLNLISFVKRIISLDKNLLATIIKNDPLIGCQLLAYLQTELEKIISYIFELRNEIDKIFELSFGENESWANFLTEMGGFADWQGINVVEEGYLGKILISIDKLAGLYNFMTGKDLNSFLGITKIRKYNEKLKNEKSLAQENNSETENPIGAIEGLYKNSMRQIMDFAVMDQEFQSQFYKLMNDFRNLPAPYAAESDARRVRRNITKLYWQLFSQVFARHKAVGRAPAPVHLMLYFGFLDETLISTDELNKLHNLVARKMVYKNIPVYNEYEFLDKIFAGQENPSITEMGETYEATLRTEGKSKRNFNYEEAVNDSSRKVSFEIKHRIAETVAVCSGSRMTSFPILTSELIQGDIEKLFVTKEKVEALVEEIRAIDYSLFYRETVLRVDEDHREIIKEEVIPNFVILPAAGVRVMLWQELDGVNKRTRGRIVIPVLFCGDLKKSLLKALANFRWELNRSIKGPMWGDPVEGGLTGAYLDYIEFFKKNSKLSTEAKAKVAERKKNLRDNKNIFAEDYLLWMTYEKEGIMKLNSVVRDIFYKNVTFNREYREKLEKMPAFSDSAVRFKNVRSREMRQYTARFKKYLDDEGNYPLAIKKFMDFLEL